MEGVKKYFWIAVIIFVVLSAYLTSGIVVQIARGKVVSAYQAQQKSEKKAVRHDTKPSINYYSVVLDRNIFNSAHNPLEGEEGAEAIAPVNLKLWGTIAWTLERSVAIIEDQNTKKIEVCKVGDKIGSYEVKKIERAKVYLASGTREEVLELEDITKVSSLTPASSESGQVGALPLGEIRQGPGGKYVVEHGFVEKALGDMGQLMRGARVIPYFKDGKVEGFKVFGIKKGSLYDQIGLKNGDIIQRVNGVELTGMEQMAQLFEMLRNESQITVDIVRGGNNQSLSYTIR